MVVKFKPCSIEGCNRNAHWTSHGAKGWCQRHYVRWKDHGNPLSGRAPNGAGLKFIEEVAIGWEENGCLLWPFGRSDNGYPIVKTLKRGKQFVHRIVCEAVHGQMPFANAEVAHSCGKGHLGCINPLHLRWTTHLENMQDCIIHGTMQKGADRYNAKLHDEDVIAIRQWLNSLPPKEIAPKFGVSETCISDIRARRTWAWLA